MIDKTERTMTSKKFLRIPLIFAVSLLLVSCSSSPADTNGKENNSETSSSGAPELDQETTVLTNYFAQAEQGGYWDTAKNDYGADQKLTINFKQGGPGIATVPQVASGTYDFGVGNADDIVIARESGLPVVALTGPIDKTLFILMAQKSTGITKFSEIDGHKVSARQGAPYWDYIKAKYDLSDVEEISFNGSMAEFKSHPNLIQQGYATSDVYLAKKNGIDVNVLSVADQAGYNPYGQVLFTNEDLIADNPELVQAVVAATLKGWKHFIEDPSDARDAVLTTNTDMDPEIFDASVDALQSDADEWFTSPVGEMSQERWDELRDQLALIGAVPEDFDVTDAWTDDFMPDD